MGRKANWRSRPWTEENVDMSPARSQKHLGIPHANRPSPKAKVSRFARIMAARKWTYQYPGISFYPDKSLADGENRLKAIIESGVTVKMPVHHNVPFEAKPNLDTGTSRSADDMLAIAKRTDLGPHAGGIIRQIRFGAHDGGRGPFSNAEVVEYANLVGEGIRAINGIFGRKHQRVISTAAVKGCLVKAWYSRPKDRKRIEYFADLLAKGGSSPDVTNGKAIEQRAKDFESHVRPLSSWLIGLKRSPRGADSVCSAYKRVERTLKAFLDGEPIPRRFRPLKGDAFPLKNEPAVPSAVPGAKLGLNESIKQAWSYRRQN